MKAYNDKNIQIIVEMIKKYKKRTKSALVRRCGKLGISEEEVTRSMDLLLELKVISPLEEEVGDGWNTRDTWTFYHMTK